MTDVVGRVKAVEDPRITRARQRVALVYAGSPYARFGDLADLLTAHDEMAGRIRSIHERRDDHCDECGECWPCTMIYIVGETP